MQQGDSVLISANISRKNNDPRICNIEASFVASTAPKGFSCNNPIIVKEGVNYLPTGLNYFAFNNLDSGSIGMNSVGYNVNNAVIRKIYSSCDDIKTDNYFGKYVYNINSSVYAGLTKYKKNYILEWDSYEDTGKYGFTFKFTSYCKNLNFLDFTSITKIKNAIIDTVNHIVFLTLSKNATLVDIAFFFTVPNYVKVYIGTTLQKSYDTKNNYSSPVIYTLRGAEGCSQDWTVTVTKSSTLSTKNDFTAYYLSGAIKSSEIDTVNHIVKCFIWKDDVITTTSVVTLSASPYSTVKLNGAVVYSSIVNLLKDTVYTITSESGLVQN